MYEQANSWTLGYNLFADVWLGTNLVDPSVGDGVCWCDVFADNVQVYGAHSRFIDNMTLTSGFSNFGMPVDNLLSDTTTTVSSWCFYHVLYLSG